MELAKNLVIGVFILTATTAGAKNGKADYEMFCGACHSPDGKGADQAAPPLAGSKWVKGDPERLVQVVLNGLQGPVEVLNKSYNLSMPPQGGTLNDEQIASIASYVRGAWGNAGSKIEPAFVAKERANKREKMWTSKELLKQWPLPRDTGPLRNLIATVYRGEFNTMPDFAKLEPIAVEEEAAGFVDLDTLDQKDKYGVVWEGEFKVQKKGRHTFRLDSDDGSQLFVNGKKVVAVVGRGGMNRTREGRILLEPGQAKLRLEYYNYSGNEGIAMSMRQGKAWTHFTRKKAEKNPRKFTPIPIVVKEEARIYRNFIRDVSARGIGVGYPGGVNLAFSADEFGPSAVWIGDFIDAGRHWSGRGQGFQPPAGQRIVVLGGEPSYALASKGFKSWPKSWQPELKARFTGYVLDEKRRPEFRYEFSGIQVRDKPEAVGGRELVRNLSFKVKDTPPEGFMMRLSGSDAKAIGSHSFQLGNGVRLEIAKSEGVEAIVTKEGVFLELKLKTGENRIGLRYVWK